MRSDHLALLTAAVVEGAARSTTLAARAGATPAAAGTALQELADQGLVAASDDRTWRVTAAGRDAFYEMLGRVGDVLAPSRKRASLPFTVRTRWRECLCFNYLVDPDVLRGLLHPTFEPVLVNGRGIISAAAATLSSMRPAGMPDLVGKNFCHVTFRAVVRFRNAAGETRVGYAFVRALTNSKLLSTVANNVTEFRFHDFETAAITFLEQGGRLVLGVDGGEKLVAAVDLATARQDPPATCAFATRAELDAQVLDHADSFGADDKADGVYVLSIERGAWHYRFVEPADLYCSYFQSGDPFDESTAQLDSVLHCREIDYRWHPLRIEARFS